MTVIPLPVPFVGGPLADEFNAKEIDRLDPEVREPLKKILAHLKQRFEDTQQNLDALSQGGILGPQNLQLSTKVATGSATLTTTTSAQDIAGATITTGAAGVYIVTGVFDFAHTGTGAGVLVGECSIDGATQTSQALLADVGSTAHRATVSQVWVTSALAAGKVIKLRARKTINAGTAVASQTHTRLLVVGPVLALP